jgi:hypothetical protein
VPTTLVLLQDQLPSRAYGSSIELSAAKGEAVSAQLLYRAGSSDERGLRFVASGLTSASGEVLWPEIGVVGYVSLRKPSLLGFHRRGDYPDPVMPLAEFSVRANRNQSLWYTVRVPPSASAGLYEGRISVIGGDGSEHALAARLRVFDVALPRTSFLKTSIAFRNEDDADERYYGKNWTPEMAAQLPLLSLAFRFSTRVDLPLLEAFSTRADGSLGTDWRQFDEATRYWIDRGMTCFELKLPIDWRMGASDIDREYGSMLEAINAHIVERGWTGLFYFYFYDEPSPSEMKGMRERLDAIRRHAPAIPNLVTYGVTKAAQRELLGRVGIWVPNLHQFDPVFARRRQALGEEVWAYDCVENVFRSYPDNFRIDWFGTAHRALGWWLFSQGAQGFLYWAVDLWRKNPWETTETYPWTNGDGALFYPAPDRRSLPYPSIRAYLMLDAIEDYDLLTLLRRAYGGVADSPAEVRALLSAKAIIPRPQSFSTDDELYTRSHERILEWLEKAGPRSSSLTRREPGRS